METVLEQLHDRVDWVMLGIDPDRLRFTVIDGGPVSWVITVALGRPDGTFDGLAGINDESAGVSLQPEYTDTHAAVANAVLALHSDRFEVARRDGDWTLIDTVAQSDVRTYLPSGTSPLTYARLDGGQLVRFNDADVGWTPSGPDDRRPVPLVDDSWLAVDGPRITVS